MYFKKNAESTCCKGWLGITSDIASKTSGNVRIKPILNLRDMSISSSFCSSSTVTVLGSNAIPQIGQEPGASRTISGCMGQVYSVFVAAGVIASGSSAIPHFGHEPGRLCRTSGCIGQVYKLIITYV